eukprot:CAMPEP_0119114938 /NCGR_PEP_ID=MMETSP1180-20130426/49188_1 /TAXON_ID=3052 ORGANISM="Chlamydomonas cf sp, Strain CCMP681" /NCGR_SAMPLE_ID=MMETSP1180 /ASSEMBLY_ACC=CAM_ASM_000741 /LENGTH=56 /DNA_ID=CAMNT_0007103687 /DNA_START=121 /DNA_END=287 /DNA_ORIENTATION=+
MSMTGCGTSTCARALCRHVLMSSCDSRISAEMEPGTAVRVLGPSGARPVAAPLVRS